MAIVCLLFASELCDFCSISIRLQNRTHGPRRKQSAHTVRVRSVSLNDMSRASIAKRCNRLATAAIQFSRKRFIVRSHVWPVPCRAVYTVYDKRFHRAHMPRQHMLIESVHRDKKKLPESLEDERKKERSVHTRNRNKVNCVSRE